MDNKQEQDAVLDIVLQGCRFCGCQVRTKGAKHCSRSCSAKSQAVAAGLALRNKDCVCEVCGATFARKGGGNAGRCCSRQCGFALLAKRAKETSAREKAERKFRESTFYLVKCKECGRHFGRRLDEAEFCSRQCQSKARLRVTRPERHAQKACAHCGKTFVPIYGARRTKHCSQLCRDAVNSASLSACRKEAKQRRRARLRGAYIARFSHRSIFERDGYICKICGQPTERSRRVPHPQAPTLDHIIPLSRGGEHSPANTQCACFICNSVKSNKMPSGSAEPMTGGRSSTYSG